MLVVIYQNNDVTNGNNTLYYRRLIQAVFFTAKTFVLRHALSKCVPVTYATDAFVTDLFSI